MRVRPLHVAVALSASAALAAGGVDAVEGRVPPNVVVGLRAGLAVVVACDIVVAGDVAVVVAVPVVPPVVGPGPAMVGGDGEVVAVVVAVGVVAVGVVAVGVVAVGVVVGGEVCVAVVGTVGAVGAVVATVVVSSLWSRSFFVVAVVVAPPPGPGPLDPPPWEVRTDVAARSSCRWRRQLRRGGTASRTFAIPE